jgi:hypothetical protein
MKWYLLLVIKLLLSTIVFAQVPPAAAESSSYINRDTALDLPICRPSEKFTKDPAVLSQHFARQV